MKFIVLNHNISTVEIVDFDSVDKLEEEYDSNIDYMQITDEQENLCINIFISIIQEKEKKENT